MKKLILTFLVLSTILMGCSSGTTDVNKDVTVKWENGIIKFGNNESPVTSYKGWTATIEGGNGGLDYTIQLDTARDVTNITLNTQGVDQQYMDTMKGKYYYSEYLGSKLTMAMNIKDDDWMVCQVLTRGNADTVVANYVSDYMDTLVMTNGQVYVDFGPFTFGNDYDQVEVRPDCALIHAVAKVSQDYVDATTPEMIMQGDKEYSVMKTSSAKYDYYVYEGYTIQLAAGLSFANYITFNK